MCFSFCSYQSPHKGETQQGKHMKRYSTERVTRLERHLADNPRDYQAVIAHLKARSDMIEHRNHMKMIERRRRVAEIRRERKERENAKEC